MLDTDWLSGCDHVQIIECETMFLIRKVGIFNMSRAWDNEKI